MSGDANSNGMFPVKSAQRWGRKGERRVTGAEAVVFVQRLFKYELWSLTSCWSTSRQEGGEGAERGGALAGVCVPDCLS